MSADYRALHSALGLHPGEASPLPDTIVGLGISEQRYAKACENDHRMSLYERTFAKAIHFQRLLLEMAGFPDCRDAYEKNLADAVSEAAYCREVIEHPEFSHKGTGADPASRRAALERALEEVEYRKRLLAALAQS
jgi:hypothetical protein